MKAEMIVTGIEMDYGSRLIVKGSISYDTGGSACQITIGVLDTENTRSQFQIGTKVELDIAVKP